MHYIEVIFSICILSLMSYQLCFNNLARDEYLVNCEAIRLVSALEEVQERSRYCSYIKSSDNMPSCIIYKDKYVIHRSANDYETYYLPTDVKITVYGSSNGFVYQQKSLYGLVTNKTIRIYKNSTSKYIIINRVGRIRINKLYAESN